MKTLTQKLATGLAVLVLAAFGVLSAAAAGKTQTLTGEVSDSMCGAKHMMGDKAACTRTCVSKGSKYSLVSGDKVYTLDTSDKAVQDQLNSLAGAQAKVTGTVEGENIAVTKVAAAK